MDISFLYSDISKLEKLLDLPSGFFNVLTKEDDWSFVIKSHAAVEAAITYLITTLTDPHLSNIYHNMPLDGKTSKLSVVESLNALDNPTREFIRRLSKLHNLLVHNVTYLSFSLDSYINNLPSNEQHQLSGLIANLFLGSDRKELVESILDMLNKAPKETMAISIFAVLARILYKINPKEYEEAVKSKKAEANLDLAFLVGVLLFVLYISSKIDFTQNS